MATIFGFVYMGRTLRHLANTTEPSMCAGDAALCQITLTTLGTFVICTRQQRAAENGIPQQCATCALIMC